MPRFDAAHLREQGQDMIIFPLDHRYGQKSEDDQHEILAELEMHAHAAGLAGTAVAVWESGNRMHFIAPEPWHPFFRSIGMDVIQANINVEVFW